MTLVPFFFLIIEDADDRVFMENLYINHRKRMYQIALQYVRSNSDADDIVSESFVSLIGRIQKLREFDDNALKAYISITVRNTAISHLRNASKQVNQFDDVSPETIADSQIGPEARLLLKCSIADMMAAIRKLGETDRAALYMRYWQELDYTQIAKRLNISPDSARMYLSRARKRLFEKLSEGTEPSN